MGVNGIYGLSGSGLDVESMVKVGMLSKQSEYEKMQQKYTLDEWKKTEFISLYGEIQTFNASTLSQYKMSSNMNSRSATSANNSSVTATANANAATMTHYVQVNQLASSAYLIGTTSPERLNTNASEKNQLSSVLFNSIGTVEDNGTTKYIVNGNDSTKYDASDVAFEFSINDGVNGLLSSSDSDAVVATATPDLATGTYKIEVSEVAKASTFGASINATADTNALEAIKTFANSSEITTDYIKSYVESNTSIAAPVIEFKVGTEGNLADVKFTYSDFKEFFDSNATVGDILKNINNQIQEQLGTDAAIQATITDGKLSFTDTSGKVGSGSEVILEANYQKAIQAITGSNTTATNNNFDPMMAQLLVGLIRGAGITSITGASATPVSEGTIQLKIPGTDAQIKVTSVDSDGNESTLFDNTGDNYNNPTGTTTSNATLNVNDLSLNNGLSITAKEVATGTSAVTIKNDSSTQKSSVVSVTYKELYDGFTFNDLTSKVNSMGLNIRFNYDSVQDRFSLYNKKSGEENQINIQIGTDTTTGSAAQNAATFFNKLSLQQSSTGDITGEVLKFTDTKRTIEQSGINAKAKVDGIEYNDLDSNSVSVDGVTYSLTNVTSEKVAVTVTQDTDTIIKNVESFVNDYNALLKKLYEWYDEKPNSDYKPLTETQKSSMKEEQIEKWEEKAKAGMLYHDKTLGNVITELRSAVSENVDGVNGKYKNIFAIGISTTGIKGQLTLDKDKLKAALADDPDAVYNVFAKLDDDEVERSSYNGIAQRLGDIFISSMKSIKAVSGSTADVTEDSELNNLMRELQTKMSNFKKMMQAFETQLYKKYDAMESSLALLGSQLNYVTSAFQ